MVLFPYVAGAGSDLAERPGCDFVPPRGSAGRLGFVTTAACASGATPFGPIFFQLRSCAKRLPADFAGSSEKGITDGVPSPVALNFEVDLFTLLLFVSNFLKSAGRKKSGPNLFTLRTN